MRTWTRSSWVGLICGACGHTMPEGAPRQVVDGAGRRKLRCVLCADEAVPADIPDDPPRAPALPIGAGVPVRHLAGLPLDWSRRRVGDREPGEEG